MAKHRYDVDKLKQMFPGPCTYEHVKAAFPTMSKQLISYHLKDNVMSNVQYLKKVGAVVDGMTMAEMKQAAAMHNVRISRASFYLNWEVKSAYIDNFVRWPDCEYITDEELRQRYGNNAGQYLVGWRYHEETQTWYAPI